jgi:hypothetical protein
MPAPNSKMWAKGRSAPAEVEEDADTWVASPSCWPGSSADGAILTHDSG